VTPGVAVASGVVELALGLVEAAAGLSMGGVAGVLPGAVVGEDSLGAPALDEPELDELEVAADASVLLPVLAPDHQSFEARCLGVAFV
jgi:hypothetical protein